MPLCVELLGCRPGSNSSRVLHQSTDA
jgi:hypothetical protein